MTAKAHWPLPEHIARALWYLSKVPLAVLYALTAVAGEVLGPRSLLALRLWKATVTARQRHQQLRRFLYATRT